MIYFSENNLTSELIFAILRNIIQSPYEDTMKNLKQLLTIAVCSIAISTTAMAKMDFEKEAQKTNTVYGITINDEFIKLRNNVGTEKDFAVLDKKITDHIIHGEKLKDFVKSHPEVIPYANFTEPMHEFNVQSDDLTYSIFRDAIYNDDLFTKYIATLRYDVEFWEEMNSIMESRLQPKASNEDTPERKEALEKLSKANERFLDNLKKKHQEYRKIYRDFIK